MFSQNLLVNGGFEEENICTEYKVNCAPEGWISTSNGFSNYFKEGIRAYNGTHCMAVEAGRTRNKYQRTYIRSQLLCRLRKGNRYRLEFQVKSPHYILDSLGVYFTNYDFLFEKKLPHRIIPSVFVRDAGNRFARGDTTWQNVIVDFTATGQENYITIGNFSKRDINGETGIYMENRFFIFIDDVSLQPAHPGEKICADWLTSREKIYDQNERHEYLQRYVRYYRNYNKLPESPKLGVTKIIVIDTLVIPDVLFAFDKSSLQKHSYELLDSFCTHIRGRQIDSIVVEGHTDSIGGTTYNERLSQERSQTVRDYFVSSCGLKASIITLRGRGALMPVATNKSPAGRQLNRRVEILLYIRE